MCGIGYNEEVNLVCDRKDQWLLDSGSNIHICSADEYILMEDKRTANETDVVGEGTEIKSTVSRTVTMMITDNGKLFKITDVLYAPEFKQKIINIARMIDKGNQVIFEDEKMTIKNESGYLICKRDQTIWFGGIYYV